MKRIAPTVIACAVLTACAPPRAGGPSPEHGFETAGQGIGQLLLSPLMIAAGLLEGISTLPYLIAVGVHELNRGMVESRAQVDLERTYRYAYGAEIEQAPDSGDTGRVYRFMDEATEHFQKVLRGYGVEDADRFILTAVRSADRDGYTLYAVVHRPGGNVRVETAYGIRALGRGDRGYYRPREVDADGRPLDVVIDWAGVSRESIRTQKGQAILMTLAANSVLVNRRSEDYWRTERRWMGGEFEAIVAERKSYLDRRLGLS